MLFEPPSVMVAKTPKETSFTGRSLVAIRDLSRPEIDRVLKMAESLKLCPRKALEGKEIALIFYEASTRTYNSFVTAIHQLGGQICGFSDASGTSVAKGETLHDTIKMFEAYADAIVMRHPKDGAARWAADTSSVPVINAGDGKNQHPTQTLLDLYAIKQTQGRLQDLSVAMVGDLKYGRTVHSLAEALALYPGNVLHLVSPVQLEMPQDLVRQLTEEGVELHQHRRLEDVLDQVDILYVTRIQRERMPDQFEYEKVKGIYRLTAAMLKDVRASLKVLHPLPRVDEISVDVDRTSHAHYFQQAAGGVEVRQALLGLLLGTLGESHV